MLDALWQSPVNKGPKQQSDGLLDVLSAQPAPLPLHQQAQDVESHISQRSFIWRSYNLREKKVLIAQFSWEAPETQKWGGVAPKSHLRANIMNYFQQKRGSRPISASYTS